MPDLQTTDNLKLFRIYNHYRVTIGLALATVSLFYQPAAELTAPTANRIFLFCYLSIHIFATFLLFAGLRPNARHITASLILEMALISGLMITGTGVLGGLAYLLIVAVAAGNILLSASMGYLLAAIATLFVLGQETLLVTLGRSSAQQLVNSGMLGAAFFTTALLVNNLSRRIRSSEALAKSRAKDIETLEELNHLILQRMLTGILLSTADGRVQLVNRAALDLLGLPQQKPLRYLPPELRNRMVAWQENPEFRAEPFVAVVNKPPIQASFALLKKEHAQRVIIFLEDTGKVTQQAQELKLMSLGRLTAGIAHEIRNPLGAASHAAQLLLESEELSDGDRKMAEIIQRHCSRMNTTIENVLQLSRGQASNPETLKILPWLEHFLQEFTASGTLPYQVKIIASDSDLSGRFDPGHLHQVLTNLLTNAIRYSEKVTGNLSAELELRKLPDSQQAQLLVRDHGEGVPETSRKHLFEPFFTTEKRGTGLGLYLCRELCDANQATLDYLQEDGAGACFRITFAHPLKTF